MPSFDPRRPLVLLDCQIIIALPVALETEVVDRASRVDVLIACYIYRQR